MTLVPTASDQISRLLFSRDVTNERRLVLHRFLGACSYSDSPPPLSRSFGLLRSHTYRAARRLARHGDSFFELGTPLGEVSSKVLLHTSRLGLFRQCSHLLVSVFNVLRHHSTSQGQRAACRASRQERSQMAHPDVLAYGINLRGLYIRGPEKSCRCFIVSNGNHDTPFTSAWILRAQVLPTAFLGDITFDGLRLRDLCAVNLKDGQATHIYIVLARSLGCICLLPAQASSTTETCSWSAPREPLLKMKRRQQQSSLTSFLKPLAMSICRHQQSDPERC